MSSLLNMIIDILKICQDKKIASISELLQNCSELTLFNIKKNLKEDPSNQNLEEFFVFTDGNCKSNGKKGSRAGYSVYFEEPTFHEKFSVTRLLETEEPTNNKAELTAILSVFKILTENINEFKQTNITICTDSMYSINCVNTWYRNWIKNGWKNSKNETVKNKDIIEQIIDLRTWTTSQTINTSFKYVPSHKDEPSDMHSLEHRLWKGNKYVDDEINKIL